MSQDSILLHDEGDPAVLDQPRSLASATEQNPDEVAVDDVQTDATQSVLSTIKELRSHLGAQSDPFDLAVPGYEGLLIVRFKWVPLQSLAKKSDSLQKIKDLGERQVAAAADVLVATCQEFLVRVGDEVQPLSQTGVPITFADKRLAESLGFDPAKPIREYVRAVFGDNEYAVLNACNAVMSWLQDTTNRVDEAFLGN